MNNNAEEKYSRRSGQIPVFGEWENANEIPITRYFDCARQAGLLRCTCSGECPASSSSWSAADPYGLAFQKPRMREVNKLGFSHSKGPINQLKNQAPVQKKHKKQCRKSGNLASHKSPVAVKPVDEDLYKISPELVKNSQKGKKMLRFFSRCMAPPCAA